ncbi:MAG: hypothetical protein WAK40_05035 [Thermoplasmata archaeon]
MIAARNARWLLPAVAATILLVSSGIGFAAFSGTATVNGSAHPASFGLLITSASLIGAPTYVLVKTTVLPSTAVQVWINNTPALSVFNLSVIVKNIGSVPATNVAWSFTTYTHGPATCSVGAYTNILTSNDPPGDMLGPGASYGTNWYLHSGSFPPSCGGDEWLSFTIAFTASAGM